MSEFKWRHFEGEIILWAVRWYCRYGISYRDLEQMMGERGVGVDHSTIYRWVQKYAPEIEKRLRWQWRCPRSTSWRVDETYLKVCGKWTYLYRGLCCVNSETGLLRARIGFMFKRRRFPVEMILLCVRWYCRYGISYRDLSEMMQERSVEVDPTTIMRWIHRYAPELEKRVRRFQGYGSTSWRVDETSIKVGGRWKYLYRAVDKHGVLIDFMLLERRNTRGAHRFLSEALTTMRDWPPSSITTGKLRSYPEAIERLKREGKLSESTRHRTSKYLNNIIEADHEVLKQVIRPTRGFRTMKTAIATIKGFEIMSIIRRGHCLTCKRGTKNEVRFVNSLFGIAA